MATMNQKSSLQKTAQTVSRVLTADSLKNSEDGQRSRPAAPRLRPGHILSTFRGRPYIFNLSHGVLPHTPIQHVELMLDFLRGDSAL